ncbi:hypothetical protein D3C81_2177440 [compost metagenome]
MYVYRQRVRHLVDSGADLCTDVYAARLSPGVRADPVPRGRFVGNPSRTGVAVCATVFRFPATL